MTAEDIKFTFDRLTQDGAMDGQTSPRKDLLGPLKAVEIVDPRTLRLVLDSAWPILPAMLPFQEVVSKSFTEQAGTGGLATQANGTGPFKLVEWRRGDSIIMERFEDYYGGSTEIPPVGPPKAERVIFRIIPENSSRVAALLAGDVHIVNELPVSAMRQVENDPNTEVMTVNGTRTFFVALNVQKPPFDDVRVRHALNHALDKQLIIDKILNGTATQLNGVLSPDAFAFNADLPAYEHDLGKAKELLAEAGYPDGFQATLDLEGAFKDTAEAIAALLAEAGVQVAVQVWEGAVLTPVWRDAAQRQERDIYLTSWGNGSLDPSDIMLSTLRTDGRGNSAGYSNPRVDELLDAADVEVDREKRQEMYLEAQEILNSDAPLDLSLAAAGHLRHLGLAQGLAAERRQPHQPARRLPRVGRSAAEGRARCGSASSSSACCT